MNNNINERASIRASIKKKYITGNTINIVTEYVLENGVCYYDIPTFTNKFGLKDKTIRRRISVAEEKPNKWDYTIKVERKQYASIGLLGFKKKNLLGKYRKDYAEFLAIYDWDTIGSLTAKNCLTIQSARKNMESLFKALKAKFPHESILFFFVTERNPGFDGYHTHFVLKYYGDSKKVIDNWIITYLKKYNQKIESNNYGNFNSVHIDNYDYNRRWEWIVYITKQIEQFSDGYDFLKTGDI